MTANGVTTNYTYDRNGRLLSGNSGGFNTAYTYNLGGLVTGLTTQKGNTAIQSHSYTYLPNGNMSGKQSTVGAQTTNYAYQYDKAGRLTNETINSVPTAYTYDAWGNRASMTGNGTSSTYTYDANNRLTKSITEEGSTTTTADYYYDHNGNQITKAVSVTAPQSGVAAYFMSPDTNSYLSLYQYDSYNRLKSADTDGTITSYTYDGNNLRQSKTSNGITTQHIWDGSNMVMDGTNKFYRGANGIEFATLNGNTSFYHKDAHGDVTALTNSAGTITQSYIYDAFGNQLNENENDINPFRYCGEYVDSETGLTYLRNRYYDNAIGRFITEDPIKDGLNWYVYCGNNPANFIDSLGLAPTTEESAEMNKQMYNFNRNSNLADIDISERTVSLSEGRVWEIHDLWVKGTVIMGVYQLVDGNGGYTELCAVFQGTNDLVDWVDNIDAYSDTFSPNLVFARNFGEGLVKYHPDVEITFSGHSKGGGEAIAAALHTARDAITFNAANFNFGNAIHSWVMSRAINIKNYYVEWEILSLLIGYSSVGKVFLIPGSGSPKERHSINTVIEGLSKE